MDALKLMTVGSRIGPLSPLSAPGAAGKADGLAGSDTVPQPAEGGPSSFASVLQQTLQQVQQLQQTADQEALKLATGQSQDLHTAMLAAEKASMALELTVQVRNKVLEAYQEIMRLPV